ncbi:MAG: hypothetical protein KA063_02870 [Firmicutes bacterium]|nr:hypothetical protein [Bacillota bacterium]
MYVFAESLEACAACGARPTVHLVPEFCEIDVGGVWADRVHVSLMIKQFKLASESRIGRLTENQKE